MLHRDWWESLGVSGWWEGWAGGFSVALPTPGVWWGHLGLPAVLGPLPHGVPPPPRLAASSMAAGGSQRPRWKLPVLLKARPRTGMVSHLPHSAGPHSTGPTLTQGRDTDPPTSPRREHPKTRTALFRDSKMENLELVSKAGRTGEGRAEEMPRWLEARARGVRRPPASRGRLRAEHLHCPFFVLARGSVRPAMQSNARL